MLPAVGHRVKNTALPRRFGTICRDLHTLLLLLLLDRRYTEGPVCKINVAVFSSSSLLP